MNILGIKCISKCFLKYERGIENRKLASQCVKLRHSQDGKRKAFSELVRGTAER